VITIFKYPVRIVDESTLEMPRGAKLLSVGVANDTEVFLWALVDTEAKMAVRRLHVHGTGNPITAATVEAHPLDMVQLANKFVGTALTHGGSLVWHLFDMGEKS
jgi:hypothetical protein